MPELDFTGVEKFEGSMQLMNHSIRNATIQDGLFCEFGVAGGGSLAVIADLIAPSTTSAMSPMAIKYQLDLNNA